MTLVALPVQLTIETQAQLTETVTAVNVRRMIYSGDQTMLVVTDELGTLTVPLSPAEYAALSASMQAIFVAYLATQAIP